MSAYRKILLATDFSAPARRAAGEAVRLARREKAELHLLYVDVVAQQDLEAFGHPALAGYIGRFDRKLRRAVRRDSHVHYDRLVTAVVHDSVVAHGILRYAAAKGIDLIVLGTQGRGAVKEKILGSVAQRVMREARVPVLLVGRAQASPAAAIAEPVILAPVALSERCGAPLARAAALARERGARLVVLHVIDRGRQSRDAEWPRTVTEATARKRLEAFVAAAGLPVEPEQLVASGEAAQVIFDLADRRGAELIVMAAPGRGRGWLDRLLLGSVTRKVARRAPCPVLVHREAPVRARRAAA